MYISGIISYLLRIVTVKKIPIATAKENKPSSSSDIFKSDSPRSLTLGQLKFVESLLLFAVTFSSNKLSAAVAQPTHKQWFLNNFWLKKNYPPLNKWCWLYFRSSYDDFFRVNYFQNLLAVICSSNQSKCHLLKNLHQFSGFKQVLLKSTCKRKNSISIKGASQPFSFN